MNFPLSENMNKAINIAQKIAMKYNNPEIGTEHILYGLLKADGSTAQKLLIDAKVRPEDLEEFFEQGEHAAIIGGTDFTARVKQTLSVAARLAQVTGEMSVGTEHVLYCLLQDPAGIAYIILTRYKADTAQMLTLLSKQIGISKGHGSLFSDTVSPIKNNYNDGNTDGINSQLPPQLRDLGIDVTQKAREHKIDPIIGRSDEIERIIQILCRKTKNNPVLIGEPGVGKSAVVEGLATAIVEGKVPELLKNKIIFNLDIGSLVAGTKYRGALEEKLKTAIDLIMRQKNIIVFIDELHTLAQAGSKEGEVTPADILKPYLARGEMQTIGATTTDEYRKFIEKDKALERRFQPIMVNPPSVQETIEILHGLRENYEAFHKVKITDEALTAAAKLSDRYITDRFLPDKAIDLIDEAMSKAKVSSNTAPPDLKNLEDELRRIEHQKQEAIALEDYKKATQLRDKGKEIEKQLNDIKIGWSKNNERAADSIGEEQIAEIVAKWTKIPVTRLTESEAKRLSNLEEQLEKRVIGQKEAIISVSKAIRRARAGLKDPNRPIGTFLFLGPTGVGKTELTKALGETMFDDENAIIRLDMSEYMEAHSVSKLIGAPPGYVGFDDGGQLTEQVRRRPYSVVLFDEIEKAHPDVYNILLQMLDDGRLTDAQGRTVSFKNTVIIMTSNVGAGEIKAQKSLGFATHDDELKASDDRAKQILTEALKRRFKPEFLNRVDVVCIFKHLSKDDIRQIASVMLKKSAAALKEKNIALEITPAAADYLLENGYDTEYGARPLRRLIEQTIEDTLAEAILSNEIKSGDTALADCLDGKIIIRKK